MSSPPTLSPSVREFDRARVLRALRALALGQEPPWLHREVGRRMAERLAVIRLQPAVWLDWWARAGASGGLVAAAYPQAQALAVEPLAGLREPGPSAPGRWWSLRSLWPRASQTSTPPPVLGPDDVVPGSVQLVWANMMLHAAMDPLAVLAQWHAALAVDGFVMFSCLGPGSLRELSELYASQGWSAPMADFVDMHDLGDMLVQAGFADPVMDQETLTLSWADPCAALAELRGLGGNASPVRFAGLRTPRWRERLLQAMESLRGPDGRVQLRFEVVYGHAVKPTPKPRMSAETAIPISDMRAMVQKRNAGI